MEKQALWKNKWVFILAAIGSAAGLGNLWKFPYLVYDNGGAAFIVAYLVMLFIVGFGLLIGEIALGQQTRKGAVGALGSINKAFSWVGWSAIFVSFGILSYYVVVIGWGMDYLYYSIQSLFTGSFAWGTDTTGFFYNNVLGLTDGVQTLGNISKPVFIGTLSTIILLYFFTFKSVKSVGKVIMVTATLPFLSLTILAIRGATLDGAGEGLSYLTTIDYDKLFSLSTWSAAGGQIFFTLSVAMGIMYAYGALKKEKSEIVKSVFIVVLGNTLISFLSAIAVFGTLGYLAMKNGVDVSEVVKGGPGLIFGIFPEIINKLPAFNSLFAIIFFSTIFMLAIDSAMSLVEAVAMVLRNKFKKLRIEVITLGIVTIIGLSSILYTFGNGLYVLDIVDHYITAFGMIIIGLSEAIILLIAWKSLGKYVDKHNKSCLRFIINKWYLMFSWVATIFILTWLLVLNIQSGILNYEGYDKSYLIFYGIYTLVSIFGLGVIFNIAEIMKKKKK
ncbi:sodium-dependent transporter [Candidatus Gracilibacteria bacterium 28_42_T64]|nr:sodium-dependent transporter [Candidatus Gracilibacteria bacterium 28_42_T64]